MKKIFLIPWEIIKKYIKKANLTPGQNRKRVEQSLFFVTILLFVVFALRLIWIVGTDHVAGESLSDKSKKNVQSTQVIQAKRGTIFDRNGVPIAIDSSSYTVYVITDTNYVNNKEERLYANSNDFKNIEKIFKDNLGMDTNYVSEQLNDKDKKYIYFGTKGSNIDFSTRDKIEKEAEKQKVKGIKFEPHLSRSYPNGQFASHFIGQATLENNDESKGLIGVNGIEASLNSTLSGKNGVQVLQKSKLGVPLPGTVESIKEATDGSDVYTTLDSSLQTYLESLVDSATKGADAKELAATLVKADTGEILATTQRPTFNPETKEGLDKENFPWANFLYQTNYEPGSTMKIFTLASAINTNVMNPNEYYTSGTYVIDGQEIHDWDVSINPNGRTMTFPQGFALSSNIGMTILEKKMGDKVWRNYLERFKFGTRTNMGAGTEEAGQFPDNNTVTNGMSSFGQGIGVNQLQMIRGYLAISNSGTMLEPHFINRIVTNNKVRQVTPEIVGKPVDALAANQTLQYMINVGTDPVYGTAYNFSNNSPYFQVEGQNVSVKTGTAQIAADAKDGGGYLKGATQYVYSAVVITPTENPEYIMYMTMKEPTNWKLDYIADVANPLLTRAMEMKDTLAIADTGLETEKIKIKNYVGEKPNMTAQELRREILAPVIIGDGGKIIKQSVSEGTSVNPNRRILLLTDGEITMPDIYGWTKFDTEKFAEWMDLEVEFTGTGNKVIGQSIEMNADISKNKKLVVNLGV
ncbi:hypothetical protein BG262_08610 [Floricoccus penangensis]|uniref:PASTA domain-containing protein n=1 Tax=Floricoccus penangensis TaxID=1859475 RepID=A0A9Q5JHQ9_9LACT|nr:penicillin-binding transpeptidase domain-containing protein [Floricoccus penangensis]OFI47749.1 hypothetical protein BG262_08610 [Floricoccus penangensis]